MSGPKNGPFRADHVGSLIRPDRLMDAREARKDGKIDAASLRAVEDACIREAVRMQEAAGLEAITDGEFRRNTWHVDFLTQFDNVRESKGSLEIYFVNADGTKTDFRPNGMAITGKIRRSHPIQAEDYKFLASATRRTPKVCIPSPSLMHFRGGREAIDKTAYPRMEGFFADLATAYAEEVADLARLGLRYLQLDDTNLAYLCDPAFRDAVKKIGEDPGALPATYCRLINDSIRTRPDDMTVCVHLCRGNASSGGVAKGSYEPVADTLFNRLDVDGLFLEYDDERSGDFAPLRFVPKGKRVVLGLVTTKRPALEGKDELRRRIDEAAKFVPLDQLALSAQCGFSSGAGRRRALTIDDERAKLDRIVETAFAVWGSIA
jgi:5-methyltetrahydropteroyltriglutamate--homocysteine methyltransferase